jgi:hypothetical protein
MIHVHDKDVQNIAPIFYQVGKSKVDEIYNDGQINN